MTDTLHQRLIERACRQGWQRGPWKPAFLAKCRENEMWQAAIEEDKEIFIGNAFRRSPDAWRIVVEGPETAGGELWNYEVLVLEFLEVEIGHPMTLDKRRNYVGLWFLFDATDCFHFRVYHMERYGAPTVWLDTDTVFEEMSL